MLNSEIISLLTKLVSFKSVTPSGKDALLFIADFLSPLGFECIIKDFGPEGEVSNLYALRGKTKPNICFAGHVDVVPALNEDLWKFHPYSAALHNDEIYGRGVVDMKGSIACALIAVKNFINSGKNFDGSISFLLTTDEEGDGTYGTQKMLEYITKKGYALDLCILGEPTSEEEIGDVIKIGRRGSVNFDLKMQGKQGHVAYPHKALNPITAFGKFLQKLNSLKLDSGTEYFEPSNIEVTSVSTSAEVSNVIPQSVSAKFNIRFNHLHTPDELKSIISGILSEFSSDFVLSYKCSSLPFCQEVSEEMLVASRVTSKICNTQTRFDTNGGTSDARFIHKFAQVMEIGLKSDQAHKINESCKIYDLQKIYDVYSELLVEFLYKNF